MLFVLPSITLAVTETPNTTACMRAAINTRETALIKSWETYTSTLKTGLSVRKEALQEAWGIADQKERKGVLAEISKTWKKTSADAYKKLRADQKARLDTFKKDTKGQCRATTTSGTEDSLGNDGRSTLTL